MTKTVENITLEISENPSTLSTPYSYAVQYPEAISDEIIKDITHNLINRVVDDLVETHYLEIVKALDMEALQRLITLEVAKKVAGRVAE
tara:strand:+ start:3792 stop:4058 length:267 start_codon:yes stop_codon:yes gene_type:complete